MSPATRLPLLWIVGAALLAPALGLLPPGAAADAQPNPAAAQGTGPVRFTEHLLQGGYGYAFGIAVADLDGDGKPDLVSADTTNNRLYWLANDGKGKFTRHLIAPNEPGWLERHAVGDVNGNGTPAARCTAC